MSYKKYRDIADIQKLLSNLIKDLHDEEKEIDRKYGKGMLSSVEYPSSARKRLGKIFESGDELRAAYRRISRARHILNP